MIAHYHFIATEGKKIIIFLLAILCHADCYLCMYMQKNVILVQKKLLK